MYLQVEEVVTLIKLHTGRLFLHVVFSFLRLWVRRLWYAGLWCCVGSYVTIVLVDVIYQKIIVFHISCLVKGMYRCLLPFSPIELLNGNWYLCMTCGLELRNLIFRPESFSWFSEKQAPGMSNYPNWFRNWSVLFLLWGRNRLLYIADTNFGLKVLTFSSGLQACRAI
jgi:hypothetical protein